MESDVDNWEPRSVNKARLGPSRAIQIILIGVFLGFSFALVGIGFLIQAVAPAVFMEAAATLFIMQSLFFVLTALAVIVRTIDAMRPTKRALQIKSVENVEEDKGTYNDLAKDHKPKSEADLFMAWFMKQPLYIQAIMGLPAVAVLTTLILIIGYFVAPDIFSFMAPVFNFMSDCFALGIQNAGALTGLVYTPEALLMASKVLSSISLVTAVLSVALLIRCFLLELFARNGDFSQKPVSKLEDHSQTGTYFGHSSDLQQQNSLNAQHERGFEKHFAGASPSAPVKLPFKVGDVMQMQSDFNAHNWRDSINTILLIEDKLLSFKREQKLEVKSITPGDSLETTWVKVEQFNTNERGMVRADILIQNAKRYKLLDRCQYPTKLNPRTEFKNGVGQYEKVYRLDPKFNVDRSNSLTV